MGITAGYHFYLLPEQTYDFMKLLMRECAFSEGTLHWIWPDGREILRLREGLTEAVRPPTPFEDAWRVGRRMAILLPEDEDVRFYARVPEPKWWERLLPRHRSLKFQDVWFELRIVTNPIRLRWETGQPVYTRVDLNANFKSAASLFHAPIFQEFVTRLAHEGNAVAVIFDSDGTYWSFLFNGEPIPRLFAEVESPERQREFLPAFNSAPRSGAATSSDPVERAAYLASQLKTGEWGNSLSFEELRPWMEDESLLVRRLAVWALRLGPVEWREVLPLLQDPSPGIRQLACEALDDAEDEEANYEESVYKLVHDPDPGVRIMAGQACLRTRYWSNVEGILLRDSHPQVQLAGEWLHAGRP